MRQAFSLVELSIVLVILGLLTGGILTGQNLIRAAELRSVTTDVERYQTAILTFRDKYLYLPGDLPNATLFWGASPTCPGTWTTPLTDAQTCNGDGNGAITHNAAIPNEIHRAWQHLANAGLIEGQYTGVSASSSSLNHTIPGINGPVSRLGQAGFSIASGTITTSTAWFPDSQNTRLYFGAAYSNWQPTTPVLTTTEAWNIDTKIDDGGAGTGSVRTLKKTSTQDSDGCATSDVASEAKYDLSRTEITCSLVFGLGF